MALLRVTCLVAVSVLPLIVSETALHAQSTLISLTGRRAMVFDHSSKYLYISTSDGYIRAFNLATNQIESGYYLGGSLNGIDIAPYDSFLLVAQKNLEASQVIIHRLSLTDGSLTNIGFTPQYFEGVTGAWDVAIASTGLALFTSGDNGGGGIGFIHQINLATNVISQRNDAPGNGLANGGDGLIENNTNIHRSADGSRFYFIGLGDSSGPVFTYDASADTFSNRIETNIFTYNAGAAINRNGSLLATRLTGNGAALDSGPSLSFVHSFNQPDGGVAFDAQSDILYAVISSAGQIVAYDTNTFAEKFRFNIGETISAGVTQFGTGTLVASADGRYLALETPSGIRVYGVSAVTPVPAPTPTFGTPRDMVFDRTSRYLYITTAEGFVWPYNLSSRTFDAPYNLGGSLNGIDIAPDDSFLLVAQGYSGITQGTFEKLDLGTGSVTNINYTHYMFNAWAWSGEWGAWDVAIASNGRAFGTTHAMGASGVRAPLRQIDLSAGSATPRNDVRGAGGPPGSPISEETPVHRSADGTRLYFIDGGSWVYTYSSASNSFGPLSVKSDCYFASGAVNRDGSLLGTRLRNTSYATLDSAPSFSFVHSFNYLDSGIAFDAVRDIFYGVNSSNDEIIAYDTNTFAEKFRFDIGEDLSAGAMPFSAGTLVASQDGHYVALITPTTVRVYSVPAVQLVTVVSEKTHGSAGAFDIDLPLDGPPAIECRSGGTNGNYTLVFTFGLNLTSVDSASITAGTGTVISGAIDTSDTHRYIVNLSGVTSGQYIRVTLTNVNDLAGNHTDLVSQQMGVLIGDVNASARVDAADVSSVRQQALHQIDSSNFRADINASGRIDAADVSITRQQTLTSLP